MWKVLVDPDPSGTDIFSSRVSVPLARDSAYDPDFSVVRPDGESVPCQARTIIHWPDGSPRWVQLDFQTNSAGEHVVKNVSAEGAAHLPVTAIEEGDNIHVSVGRLEVTLSPAGPGPIAAIQYNGRELTSGDDPFRFAATHEAGTTCPLAASGPENVATESAGPHRYQISWDSRHRDDTDRVLDVRFRLEFLAGVEGFSLSYQFLHKTPGHDFLRLKGIESSFSFDPLAKGGDAVIVQEAYSNLWCRRFVRTRKTVAMTLDRTAVALRADDAGVLDDDSEYPYFLQGGNRIVGSVFALQNDSAAVICTMRDMEHMRPKTVAVQPGRIHFGIWPESAGALILPQGRSCRQIFDFRFTDADTDAVDKILVNPQNVHVMPAAAWLDKADSADAGATWDQPRLFDGTEQGAAFFSYFLNSGAARWGTVSEMFHYGDTPDTGYTMNYPTIGRTPDVDGKPVETILDGSLIPHGLLQSPDHLPVVWTNNEYDAIYCLALEAIRTHDTKILEFCRAAARHQIEVDFVHYSDHWQHHRSTPQHGYDHVTTMSSLPSHHWTQGLYYYYVLTGDDDVPEIVRAICDFLMMYHEREEVADTFQFDREQGWSLVALVFGYEFTADERYIKAAADIIRKLQACAEKTDFEDLERKYASNRGLNASGIGLGFNVNTIPLGVKAYSQATGEKWAVELLLRWVKQGTANFNDRGSGVKITELFLESLCCASALEQDTDVLTESLWHLRGFFRGFNSCGWLDEGRLLTTKQFCRVYRGLIHYLSALAREGLLEDVEEWLIGSKT